MTQTTPPAAAPLAVGAAPADAVAGGRVEAADADAESRREIAPGGKPGPGSDPSLLAAVSERLVGPRRGWRSRRSNGATGMKRTVFVVAAAVAAVVLPTAGSPHGEPPRETVTVAADEPIPNLPGKRLAH